MRRTENSPLSEHSYARALKLDRELRSRARVRNYYKPNKGLIEDYFAACRTAMYLLGADPRRELIRQMAESWVHRINYEFRILLDAKLPFAAREFENRVVDFDQLWAKQVDTRRTSQSSSSQPVFNRYWKEVAEPTIKKLDLSRLQETKDTVRMAYTPYYDIGLGQFFYDKCVGGFESVLRFDVNSKLLDWKEYDTRVGSTNSSAVDIGLHNFSAIVNASESQKAKLRLASTININRSRKAFVGSEYLRLIMAECRSGDLKEELGTILDSSAPVITKSVLKKVLGVGSRVIGLPRVAMERETDLEAFTRSMLVDIGYSENSGKVDGVFCENQEAGLKLFLNSHVDLFIGGVNQSVYLTAGYERSKAVLIELDLLEAKSYSLNGLIASKTFLRKRKDQFIKLAWLFYCCNKIFHKVLSDFRRVGTQESMDATLVLSEFMAFCGEGFAVSNCLAVGALSKHFGNGRTGLFDAPSEALKMTIGSSKLVEDSWRLAQRSTKDQSVAGLAGGGLTEAMSYVDTVSMRETEARLKLALP